MSPTAITSADRAAVADGGSPARASLDGGWRSAEAGYRRACRRSDRKKSSHGAPRSCRRTSPARPENSSTSLALSPCDASLFGPKSWPCAPDIEPAEPRGGDAHGASARTRGVLAAAPRVVEGRRRARRSAGLGHTVRTAAVDLRTARTPRAGTPRQPRELRPPLSGHGARGMMKAPLLRPLELQKAQGCRPRAFTYFRTARSTRVGADWPSARPVNGRGCRSSRRGLHRSDACPRDHRHVLTVVVLAVGATAAACKTEPCPGGSAGGSGGHGGGGAGPTAGTGECPSSDVA